MRNIKEVKGLVIPKLGFTANKLGDLIYHEGPLLSLFIDIDNPNTYYLYKWVDCSNEYNRWLISPIDKIKLQAFFSNKFTLRDLLLKCPINYIVDIDDNLENKIIKVCLPDFLPQEYFPGENSYFNEKSYTEFASLYKYLILRDNIQDTLKQLIYEINIIKKEQKNMMDLLVSSLFLKTSEKEKQEDSFNNYEIENSNYDLITSE